MRSNKRKKVNQRKRQQKNKQIEGWLNRYGFAYAGRDNVNQVFKNLKETNLPSKIIKNASHEVDKVLEQRINQIIKSGGAEVRRIVLGILRGAIEEVYKTPFRLLGKIVKRKLTHARKKITGVKK